ncbi:hypothetical protein BJ741DRAFT_79457 [Chytriomyces cf. hyalinus JEL632]|nr:hypothetical protein BJ741DRAFT_79457 [Chytriomyces cf. hyalinus JEL632]
MLGSTAATTTPEDFSFALDDELRNADERTRTLPESDDDLRTESNLLQALEDAVGAAGKGPQKKARDKAEAAALAKSKDPHWDEREKKMTMKEGPLNCTYGKNVNHGSVAQLEWMIRQHKLVMDKSTSAPPIITTPITAARIADREPKLHRYFGKELYRFAPFRQYPTLCGPNFTECPRCGRTDSWCANGYSITFRRVVGLSKRSFAYTAKYRCVRGSNGRGCGNEWQAWDEEMMAKYPPQVQHEFPFIITPKWMITKELLNFILVSQHVMGMSQIYRMLRAMYFHTFLTDMHVYSDHLKEYARSIRRTQSQAEAAAFLKTHVPLIGKHSSTLFELCTNTYRYDGAWPSLDFLDEVCRKQFERVIKPIADRVQSSVSAEYLAFDTTKKITSKVQVNGCPVFGGLEIACNEYHEIPHWAFRTSEDSVEFERSVKSLIHRLKGLGCKLKGIFLDNCCTWGDVFRRVFSSLLEDEQKPQIFLDRAHFLMRFTEAAKKDSPLWDSFRRDLSTAVCYSRRVGPNEGGSFSDIKKNVVQIPYSQDQMKVRVEAEHDSRLFSPRWISSRLCVIQQNSFFQRHCLGYQLQSGGIGSGTARASF